MGWQTLCRSEIEDGCVSGFSEEVEFHVLSDASARWELL